MCSNKNENHSIKKGKIQQQCCSLPPLCQSPRRAGLQWRGSLQKKLWLLPPRCSSTSPRWSPRCSPVSRCDALIHVSCLCLQASASTWRSWNMLPIVLAMPVMPLMIGNVCSTFKGICDPSQHASTVYTKLPPETTRYGCHQFYHHVNCFLLVRSKISSVT